MAATKGRSEGTEPSFDERLARLEAIVNELEHGGIALEPAIERYQEGIALLKDCRTILSGFKRRVEELSASADAGVRPYDGDPDANGPGRGPLERAVMRAARKPTEVDAWLARTRAWADAELERAFVRDATVPARLDEAIRYALFGGGKRLRPALVRLVCAHFGGDDARAALPAVAVECVHTYSLVHDDLPCMDDDDLRRGRPTCHKVFGEALAVLVGDALLTQAFALLAQAPEHAAELVAVLAAGAGASGMVGGQALDLAPRDEPLTHAQVALIHRTKTAALLGASAELGALAAHANTIERERAHAFGVALGLCFQAIDDILDVEGDALTLGKTPGKDARLDKPTLVAALGLEGARDEARRLARAAHAAAEALGCRGGDLAHDLVTQLLERRA